MTFYALSSGPGLSGVAVIRVSGSETVNVIKHLTNSSLPKPKEATLKKFINKNNELIDEGILLWFPGPNSYTGEDMAEFHVHGSRAVIEAIQTSISEVSNCRLASPGEFTKTAFQNGKIDLLKAEGISDLISSETEIQRLQAIKIMEGKSSKIFETLRHTLIKVLSKIEAKIDFPDEDLPIEILDGIKADTARALADLEKLLDDQRLGERIREGFKISIIGPTIHKESYEIKKDVALIVKETEFYKKNHSILFHVKDDKYLFDLPLLIKESLKSSKITNFGDIYMDTYEKSNLFFSHRKSSHKNFPKEGRTGRHISVIGLIDK